MYKRQSSAWDVATITYVTSFEVGVVSATQGDNSANSIEFNTDGTILIMLGQNDDKVFEYALSSGFDLSTASYTDSFDISTQEGRPYGLDFIMMELKCMFVVGVEMTLMNIH